jgi:hypothetical protein
MENFLIESPPINKPPILFSVKEIGVKPSKFGYRLHMSSNISQVLQCEPVPNYIIQDLTLLPL